jgi:hypothetical protein
MATSSSFLVRGRALLARLTGLGAVAGMALAAIAVGAVPVRAQSADPVFELASRSAIVVLGTVARVSASEEPLLAASPATVVVRVQRMFAGSEFAGDQTGRTVTVILSKPGSVRVGTLSYFFGNPRFVGKALTIADVGEVAAPSAAAEAPPSLARGLQARRDVPVRERLAIAAMVFRGTVESERPLEGTESAPVPSRELRDEHDPDWHVAQVRVKAAFKGTENGTVVPVIFPASRDIVWFNTPKLRPGDDVVVIGHRPQQEEQLLLRSTGVLRFLEEQRAVLATQPFDVLPPSDQDRVRGLLNAKEVR